MAFLAAVAVVGGAEESVVDPLEGLTEYMDELRHDFQVPGVAVVVVGLTPAPAIFVSGQRAVDDDTPVTADTLFHIASVTKTFNATLAATLVDEGRLEWDTRVKQVIPEFEVADPVTSERATLRDLLSHRIGFARNSVPSFNLDEGPEWWLPRLKLLKPHSEFRDQSRYSGVMVTVSGLMLARAGGAPWPELVRARLLDPLGMRRTTVAPRFEGGADLAVGHVEKEGRPVRVAPVSLSVEVAQSGLYSTARDMGRWLQLLIGEGSVDGTKLVSKERMHEMWTPNSVQRHEGSAGDPAIRANGLGWLIWSRFDSRWLSHAGGGVGYAAQLSFLPDRGVGIAVLSNRSLNPIPDLVSSRVLCGALGEPCPYPRERALAMVARMIAMRREQKAAMLEERVAGAEPAAPLTSYVGQYDHPLYGTLQVDLVDESLRFSFHKQPLEATFLHDHVFLLWSPLFDGLRARFEVASDSGVESLRVPIAPHGEEVVFRRSE